CEEGPCKHYTPPEKSLYVLETNSGFTSKNQIKVGDDVRL
ncbi:MAG: DUF192 domain-containing protein, partial [Nanoarchaeota archaeon]|nr:DUF192 domain-containing protein [Nanoarchaeota archaeon]